MRRSTVAVALVLLLSTASLALASGSSGAVSSLPSAGSEGAIDVTKNLKCTVIEVREGNVIKVRDDRSGDEHYIQLSEDIPLKAASKKQFGGRKNLEPSDLEIGQRILVTKRTDVDSVVRIKVLKKKAA